MEPKKLLLPYGIFVTFGLAIDYSLMNYNIDIPYSFSMLFSSIFIYGLRKKYYPGKQNIIMQFFRFVILPIMAKFAIFG